MKILLAHNYYQSSAPSGEDAVFLMEKQLLEQAGHEVIAYERHNDEIGTAVTRRIRAAVETSWSLRAYRDVTRLIKRHRPHVAHFHNTFPLISPSAYRACRMHNVPVVQTLHNYRLICPGALLMRDGSPCEKCVGGSVLPAIKHACYRGSRAASSVVASMLTLHRVKGTYAYDVDRYIALTNFARARFIRGGLPANKIVVRPNFLVDAPNVGEGKGSYALYVGRLTPEKGVATLVRAWRGIDLPLKVAGDGYLKADLEKQSRDSGARIEFLGYRARAEVLSLMRDAKFVVIPSECYEGFPVTLVEAFATGTPVLVSAIGALDELVTSDTNGLKFISGDADSLHTAAQKMLSNENLLIEFRRCNRERFDSEYTARIAVTALTEIYKSVATRQPTTIPALAESAV